jgi:hypothetical protein
MLKPIKIERKLNWEYTRTHRKHYVYDGNYYGDGFHNLFEIRDCTPYGFVRQCRKDGYELLYKGKKIAHGKSVKVLKDVAEKHNKGEPHV